MAEAANRFEELVSQLWTVSIANPEGRAGWWERKGKKGEMEDTSILLFLLMGLWAAPQHWSVCVAWFTAGYLLGACNGWSDCISVLGNRAAQTSGEADGQPTADLFPLPLKHTQESWEQEKKKWIHICFVYLA